jgi:large subunit ribosomal protein L35
MPETEITSRVPSKRFKKTATGKITRGKAFRRHILTSKSRSRKRGLRRQRPGLAGRYAKMRKMLPYD